MPIYVFEHPDSDGSGPFIEVVQKMNEPHEYSDENGVAWNRVFMSPNASVDSDIDPFDMPKYSRKCKHIFGVNQQNKLKKMNCRTAGDEPADHK